MELNLSKEEEDAILMQRRQLVYSVQEFRIELEDGRYYLMDKRNEDWDGDEIDGGYVNRLLENISKMNFDEAQAYVTEEKLNKRIVYIRRSSMYQRDGEKVKKVKG